MAPSTETASPIGIANVSRCPDAILSNSGVYRCLNGSIANGDADLAPQPTVRGTRRILMLFVAGGSWSSDL